jgi:hypothetical protein
VRERHRARRERLPDLHLPIARLEIALEKRRARDKLLSWGVSRTLVLGLLLAGCASAAAPADDLLMPPGFDLSCIPGTPDDCTACGKSCPGVDNDSTTRTCGTADGGSGDACNILCKADFYDVDGDPTNGCELEDPNQNTVALAVAVTLQDLSMTSGGTCDNTGNGCTVSRAGGSDARAHDSPPTERPLGLIDWWVITAIGTGTSNPMTACLSISNFDWPTDNTYEICMAPTSGSMTPTLCATAMPRVGGVCVSPTGNPDAGTFYLTVAKTAGSPTALGYAIYLEH